MQEGCFALQARISSYETDLFSNMKLSSMARYFQEIAGRQLRENGLSYTFLREHGYVFLITKLNLLVYRYPKHMQDVVFETWAKPLGKGAEFIRCYEVRDLHGTVLAEATTHWVLADPVTHKIVRPTSWTSEQRHIFGYYWGFFTGRHFTAYNCGTAHFVPA